MRRLRSGDRETPVGGLGPEEIGAAPAQVEGPGDHQHLGQTVVGPLDDLLRGERPKFRP